MAKQGNLGRGAGSTCRLKRNQVVQVVRLAGCENFIGK